MGAPNAFLVPISLVLSVTETNIIFIIPMLPTIKDIDAITASTITSRAFANGVATAVNVLSAIAGTPVLIDTATGASSSEWTAPADSTVTK